MKRPINILDEAKATACGVRQRQYGTPKAAYTKTAKMWSEILGVEVNAKQVCLCMVALKIARECGPLHKRDNLVDIAGYAWCAEECV